MREAGHACAVVKEGELIRALDRQAALVLELTAFNVVVLNVRARVRVSRQRVSAMCGG